MTCDLTNMARVGEAQLSLPHLYALHGDVVDDPDDATGTGHGQQGVTGAAVVGPRTCVEVLVSLRRVAESREQLTEGDVVITVGYHKRPFTYQKQHLVWVPETLEVPKNLKV